MAYFRTKYKTIRNICKKIKLRKKKENRGDIFM